jgi:hypothetical protein
VDLKQPPCLSLADAKGVDPRCSVQTCCRESSLNTDHEKCTMAGSQSRFGGLDALDCGGSQTTSMPVPRGCEGRGSSLFGAAIVAEADYIPIERSALWLDLSLALAGWTH